MNGETRRILREDGCLVILALIAVMLATCARCEPAPCPCDDYSVTDDGCNTTTRCCGVGFSTALHCPGARVAESPAPARQPAPPEHWSLPPSTEEFRRLQGDGPIVIALSAEAWSAVLHRLEIADATEVELAKAHDALTKAREALRLVQAENAQDREDEATIADGDRALLRCESVKRGWRTGALVVGGIVLGGVAAREFE